MKELIGIYVTRLSPNNFHTMHRPSVTYLFIYIYVYIYNTAVLIKYVVFLINVVKFTQIMFQAPLYIYIYI